jgi:hypothetical protein
MITNWFDILAAGRELPDEVAAALHQQGFVVLPSFVPRDRLDLLAHAYDAAVSSASDEDLRIGSTSTRVNDFVNRGEDFDALYILPPLLDACCRIIKAPFKLSSLHARTLHAGSPCGELHVDVLRDSADFPLVAFILMVDDFRPENGATRLVPGSHHGLSAPEDSISDLCADYDGQLLACGPAGSVLIFNGSVWHGHSANTSDKPRRSIQGAFIPLAGKSAIDFAARMQPETRARLTPLAQYLLAC